MNHSHTFGYLYADNDNFVVYINHSDIQLSAKVDKLYDTVEFITANVMDNGYKSVLKKLL